MSNFAHIIYIRVIYIMNCHHSPIVSYKLDIVARMACLDAIHANRIPIRCIARLTPIEVVHRKRRITADLVQTLATRDGLLHFVLILENLIPTDCRLNAARQTQSAELIVEYLIELQRCARIVCDLHTGRQSVKDPIASQHWM